VQARNQDTENALFDSNFEQDKALVASILQDPDKPFNYRQRGNYWFDFHQDKTNPKGIWRRLTTQKQPTATSDWEVVFDLDDFCRTENRNWVWNGVRANPANPQQVLLALADDGSDRCRFVEFDCATKAIVPDGFDIPAAKADAGWLDADTLLICTSSDAGNATTSGWPRVAKRLQRGMIMKDAPTVFEAEPDDVSLYAHVESTASGLPLLFFIRYVDLGQSVVFTGTDPRQLQRLDLPLKSGKDLNQTHIAFSPDDTGTFQAGSLMLGRINQTSDGLTDLQCLFTATNIEHLGNFFLSHNWIYWQTHENLAPRLFRLNLHQPDAQAQEIPLPAEYDFIRFNLLNADPRSGDDRLLITALGLIRPPTTFLFDPDSGAPLQKIHRTPARFNAAGMQVQLNYAISDDGTKIPYHIALPANHNAQTPVRMYGYGGFSVSLYPFNYLGIVGKTWLERGGAYVVAYIRGGVELGPNWHLAAKGENRHKAFEDFKSVAADITARGLSSPERISCEGGSNGGLLAGVMLTRYPQHFGAIVSGVPVLDMTRFHLFAAGQAWIDEYGDPENPDDRRNLLQYSPFHQLTQASKITYPPALFYTHQSDDRVDPSHARRMVAKLRDAGHTPLFYEFSKGGHGGGGDLGSTAQQMALILAFLRHTTGKGVIDPPQEAF